MRLLAVDGVRRVTAHFEKVRTAKESASSSALSSCGRPVFLVSPHLLSPEREAEYLSKLAETLLFFLWPKSYGRCAPVRHLLKVN